MNVAVTGIGSISALGNLEGSWKRLLRGESGIELHQLYDRLPSRPLGLIDSVGDPVFSADAPVFSPHGAKRLKDIDLTLLTARVVTETVESAGLMLPLPECGVVIGSSRGYQGILEQFMPQIANKEYSQFPITNFSFPNLLPQMVGIEVARKIGSLGPAIAPMAACATGIWAIALACELIETGQCQRAIAGAVEAPITPLTLAGFQQMGALAQTGCYPFDRHREGLALGEGGAMVILESAELARKRSAPIWGRVLGFSLTNDACFGNAPDLTGKSARVAIAQCLNRSNLCPKDIDYIHAHGTSTKLNDKHEALLIETMFPHRVAVSSTKGATGHTLGASGALGVGFSLMALKHQILPPCVGLKEPEFDLDLVQSARQSLVRQVLCLSFGFGGQNAAIALAGL